jgi:hypothetical protein
MKTPFANINLWIIVIVILISSCKKVVFREITCRPFELTDEHFWFPSQLGDTIRFANAADSVKEFVIRDMYINHQTKYTSDTGCGCADRSSMLLTSSQDSIWFVSTLNYIEDQTGNRYEDLVFVINGQQSAFYETHRSQITTTTIDTTTINDLRFYQRDYSESTRIKKIFTSRNLGLVQFETVGGEIWTNTNMSNTISQNRNNFNYNETTCQ